MTRTAVGVDVGGTSIKAGVATSDGEVLFSSRVPTPADSHDPAEVIAAISEAIWEAKSFAQSHSLDIVGAGIGVPHYSVGPEWIQTGCENIRALEGVALRPAIRPLVDGALACELDTNAATLAEFRYGAGAGVDRWIFIAIGTGISSGIVVDGTTLLNFTYGTAGNTGHIVVDPVGRYLCTCGGRGCLETLASGRAIREHAVAAMGEGQKTLLTAVAAQGDLEARDVAEAAWQGDEMSRQIFERAGRALGISIVSLMHIFAPHRVIIGGGVSGAGDLLLDPARSAIDELASPFYRRQLEELRLSAVGIQAGLLGAATLVLAPFAAT